MMATSIKDKIRLKELQINLEDDPKKKQDLQIQLKKLQLKKEIETIRTKIEKLR